MAQPNDDSDDPQEAGLPLLLQYIQPVLAAPADIRRETLALLEAYRSKYGRHGVEGRPQAGQEPGVDDEPVRRRVAKKIISNYSYMSAMTGGASALTGVIPGLGTVLATAGGTAADVVLLMKWNIEMVMSLATLYGHDVTDPNVGRACYVIAGLGATAEAGKKGAERIGNKAFVRLVERHLAGGALVAVREVFSKAGLRFTRRALLRVAPFGVGVVIGFSVNKTMTYYVGQKTIAYYETT